MPPMGTQKVRGPSPTHCTLVADMHGSLSVQHRAVVGGYSNNGRRRVVVLRSPHGPIWTYTVRQPLGEATEYHHTIVAC